MAHVRITVAGRGDHVDDAAAQVYLRGPIRPVGEAEELAHAVKIGRCDGDAGPVLELHVARTVVPVTVGMHHGQRQFGAADVGQRPITVSASGMALASATAPLSISSARLRPTSRYRKGAS